MITTTLAVLLDAEPALAVLEQLLLPAKTAYHIAKLTRLVTVETQIFKTRREALIRELGAERPTTDAERAQGAGPTTTQVTPANWDVYVAKANELAEVEVEIAWRPLTVAQLDGATVRPSDLRHLGPLLAEDDAPAPTPPPPPPGGPNAQ